MNIKAIASLAAERHGSTVAFAAEACTATQKLQDAVAKKELQEGARL